MTAGGQVAFTYEWETPPNSPDDEPDYIELRVTAQISQFHPAVMHLSNGDPGYPAEGGEVEGIEASFPDGSVLDPIPDDLYALLEKRASQEEVHRDDGL